MRMLRRRQRLHFLHMLRTSPRRASLNACYYRPVPKRRGTFTGASAGRLNPVGDPDFIPGLRCREGVLQVGARILPRSPVACPPSGVGGW